MTKEEAVKKISETIKNYVHQRENISFEELAQVILDCCENDLEMIKVSPKNVFWDIAKGRFVDPDTKGWDETGKPWL